MSLNAGGAIERIYGDDYITSQMGVAGAILIILGIYLIVFGFRAFRPTMAVSGFIIFGKPNLATIVTSSGTSLTTGS